MRTYAEIDAELTAPGQFFEIETIDIRGVPTRTWKAAASSIGDILERGSATAGDRTYLVYGNERITHSQHRDRVGALAERLVHELGVRKGDFVAIAMRNYPEWSVAFFATTLVGAVAVPLNAFWNGAELAFGVTDSTAKVVIADGERLERLAAHTDAIGRVALVGVRLDDRPGNAALPAGVIDYQQLLTRADPDATPSIDVDPDDPATLFYTSGTTGHPKGVLGSHRNLATTLVNLMYVGARGAKRSPAQGPATPPAPHVGLVPVPLFHATGCHCILVAQAMFGGTLIFMRKWDVEEALDIIEREGVTSLSGVPSMVWDLVNSPTLAARDVSRLTNIGGGGAAAAPELIRRVATHLPGRGLGTGYGLTESSSLVTSIGGDDFAEHPDSVGVPVPVCEVRIVRDDGTDAPTGERGEIWVKGPNVVGGYWRRPEETAATFTEGWLHTGDIGCVDDEGYLYIVDRAKDIIIRGGENISSIEVEAAIYEHPAVAEAAVFATPHQVLGEEVAAVVRLRDGQSETGDDLRDHVASRVSAFKVPAHIWIVDEPLPRNPAGKVLKPDLRRRYAAAANET